uniref:Uncharacterized protein n=1 Tax=Rhizophora mucronata TaxID=61149 RepID=A0A2P2PYC1_RHIMU
MLISTNKETNSSLIKHHKP